MGLHRAHHGRLLLALLPCCQFSREPDGKMDCDYRVVPARDWLFAGLAFVQPCIYIHCSRFTNIECQCSSNPKTSL